MEAESNIKDNSHVDEMKGNVDVIDERYMYLKCSEYFDKVAKTLKTDIEKNLQEMIEYDKLTKEDPLFDNFGSNDSIEGRIINLLKSKSSF